MKNPEKPGDFGTNGTRGVVLSGMSETTKRWSVPLEDPPSLFDRRAWEEATNEQRARWLDGMRNAAPRPSTLAAEGGAERETTNSPAEIGAGCTGRKMGCGEDVSLCCCDPVHSRIDLGSGRVLDRMGRCRLVRMGQPVRYIASPRFWWGHPLMCHRCVIVKRDGGHLYAWSRGELAKHLGCKVSRIPKLGDGWPRLGFRDCLCSVDFEVIAKRHKMTHVRAGSDGPFWDDHVLTELGASGGEGV